MNCPKCNNPMETGYIHGNKISLRWSKKEKEISINAGKPIGEKAGLLHGPYLKTWHCNQCNINLFKF